MGYERAPAAIARPCPLPVGNAAGGHVSALARRAGSEAGNGWIGRVDAGNEGCDSSRTERAERNMMHGIHEDQIPRETHTGTGLPIGPRLADPGPATAPERIVLEGRYARLEPIDPGRHRDDLHAASTPPDRAERFRYMPELPPGPIESFGPWLATSAQSPDPLFFAVVDRATGRAEGWQTLMRITPVHRCIEIGNIYWGPRIAGTRVATEAMYLFATHALETLGYRRYEWKCDALNAPSRRGRVAVRLHLGGTLPPRGDHPRAQSRHVLVLDHRRGVAGAEGGLRAVAHAG